MSSSLNVSTLCGSRHCSVLISCGILVVENDDDQVIISLGAHVFYRALENIPLLVRAWYESCKDRQLAMSFISTVTKHFSSVLIEQELSILRQPGALTELADDDLTVKILSGSPEVNVKYIVDEQPMEISIRLPGDFPLRNVEVKEISRVGVTEGKWRGWMMNVQQLIMSRVSFVPASVLLMVGQR